jgi:NAD+ diphosphatase
MIRYAGGVLDRAAKLREDDDWLSAAFVSDDARAVLINDDRNLVSGLADGEVVPRAATVPLSEVRKAITDGGAPWAFLGLNGEVPVFAVEVTGTDVADLPAVRDAGQFIDLRKAGWLVPEDEAAMLAYAKAMLTWQRRYRFCAACGSPAECRKAGHVLHCTNPSCGADAFPRTDPVVIMLVIRPADERGPARCLLGRHRRLPPGAYSLLAGFVEPGESLEDAVAREVWEESGIRVRDVRYEASQPWPFPYTMMTGFSAIAETDEIVVDTSELEDARWFTAAELAQFGEWGDETARFRRPRKDAIARVLMDSWIEEELR